jgi:uncharacterized protein (DUF2147 family)
MRTRAILFALAAIVGTATPLAAQSSKRPPAAPPAAVVPSNPYVGLWVDHTGDGVVEIASCSPEEANKLCGRIVWLRAPTDSAGRPLTDGNNPEPAHRTRPICGLPILGALAAQPDGTYDTGWIYDPRQGKAFDVSLSLLEPERMQVMGYKGIKLFNKKFVWSKTTANVPRCAAPRV